MTSGTFRVALTGGIASGKTTVANMFGELGATLIDTDIIARDVVEPGTPGLVQERGHPGHGGGGPHAADGLAIGLQDALNLNPGGLAVLWAEENTRD